MRLCFSCEPLLAADIVLLSSPDGVGEARCRFYVVVKPRELVGQKLARRCHGHAGPRAQGSSHHQRGFAQV